VSKGPESRDSGPSGRRRRSILLLWQLPEVSVIFRPPQTGSPVLRRLAPSPLDDILAGEANQALSEDKALGMTPRIGIRGECWIQDEEGLIDVDYA
jgi:hypothetical protein